MKLIVQKVQNLKKTFDKKLGQGKIGQNVEFFPSKTTSKLQKIVGEEAKKCNKNAKFCQNLEKHTVTSANTSAKKYPPISSEFKAICSM